MYDVLPATEEVLNELRKEHVLTIDEAQQQERNVSIQDAGFNAWNNRYIGTFHPDQELFFLKVHEASREHINTTHHTKVHIFNRICTVDGVRNTRRHMQTDSVFWAKRAEDVPSIPCRTDRSNLEPSDLRRQMRLVWVALYECEHNHTHEPLTLPHEEGGDLKLVGYVTSVDVCPIIALNQLPPEGAGPVAEAQVEVGAALPVRNPSLEHDDLPAAQ